MKLDSRIKDILYIADCFTTETYKKYIGTECYMTKHSGCFHDGSNFLFEQNATFIYKLYSYVS